MVTIDSAPPPATLDLEVHQVRRAQTGDAAAFRWLFERHAPSVRRFLMDVLRNVDAADECTQETFVRAHRQLPGLRDNDRFRTWLFSVAHRVSQEQRRKLSRAPVSSDGVPEPASRALDPEATLLGQEADRLIDAALASLPDERRVALLLRLDHGLGYEAIAEMMGWSLAKAKVEIHRARLLLREHVGAYVEGAS